MIANPEEFGCHSIPSEPPTFTTPTLDFQSHSSELKNLVDKLYEFRDSYFLFNSKPLTLPLTWSPQERLKEKEDKLKKLQEQTLYRLNQLTTPPMKKKKLSGKDPLLNPPEIPVPIECGNVSSHLFDPTLSSNQKSMYHYLRGRILDVDESNYSKIAEEELGKAVKLNPKFVDGWNALGECLWKKGDRNGSIYCFKAGLKMQRNKTGLLNLALVLRSGSTTVSKEQLMESITLCKEAISMQMQDGKSWHGLGTSYIKLFFDVTRDSKDLQRALAAYNKAESSLTDPDLYRNRAIIHQYLENYEKAISDYKKAGNLDPGFTESCVEAIQKIENFSKLMQATIAKRLSETKPKSLNTRIPAAFLNYQICGFRDLNPGLNCGKLLKFRVVGSLQHGFANAFIGDDGVGGVGAAILYNIRMDLVKPNDVILISAPHYQQVILDERTGFWTVRSESPERIIINGQALDSVSAVWTSMHVDAVP